MKNKILNVIDNLICISLYSAGFTFIVCFVIKIIRWTFS